MKVILDSCSTINLYNGDLLENVLDLGSGHFEFYIGTIVLGECSVLIPYLDKQARQGRISILPCKRIAPARFAEVLNFYELGVGETECLVHAELQVLTVCTDDRAARAAAAAHLGEDRVVGSLRLVRECVSAGAITSARAYLGYESMKTRGAFLPEIAASYFQN